MPPRFLLAALALAQTATALGQTPAPALTFEVTSVKRSHVGTSSSHSGMDNSRFIALNVTVKNLMQYTAFDLPEPRILGGPRWLTSARFDIEAKLDATTFAEWNRLDRHQHALAGRAMFQQLLADRFHLRYHWETHTLPLYALVVAKSGPHLRPSNQIDADTDTNDGQIDAKGVTLAQFAQTLTQELSHDLGRIVIDQTSLPGLFDLTLKWTPDTESQPTSATDAAPNAAPPLFTALQEQLGLKLIPTKGPVQVLVIDQLDPPAEN